MERNPGMAKGFLRTQNARERSRRQWEELAVRLNSIGGTIKTYKQWTKYWSDKKSAIKKKVAAHSAARRRTGGGVEDEVELSELEERVVALCGGESFSTGDAHLGIQPFPVRNLEMQQVSQAQPGALLCVIYFITTALKTVKENIVRKPTCPRTKNSKTCDIHQSALGPRGGLWPFPSPRERRPMSLQWEH
ncbi:hypothetical protein PYW08_004116 [Mythimna loreyi]|uniref:Uncharacterized protein n=1 Tax=Mythimna loreyi TaxID=667449 RepID=A0ACC2QVJ3_9NEOP|nr:hypothetical protein PYW08_004116 [Mythimna loreyi]